MFFNAANPEVLIKVLDGCGFNNHYWVFYAATTSVGFDLTVRDTTTGDSMTYCVSVSMSQSDSPSTIVRVFWGVAMGVMALILISVGSGGVGKLQSFIVITAVPVSLVLLPSLWDAVRITILKGREVAKAG